MFPRLHEVQIPDPLSEKGYHTLAYTEWGDHENPDVLVCVHGLTRNGRDFDYLAESLEKRYRIVCPDMPGRGRSEWLADTSRYNYATYIADSIALLDSLNAAKVDWVGTSMGGLIGMFIASGIPERINKLVINDVGPFIPGKALQRINKYVGVNPTFHTVLEVETHLRTTLAPFGITNSTHWNHIAEHSAMKRADGTLGLAYDVGIVNAFQGENGGQDFNDVDLWEIWEKIAHPTLVLRGETSDILLPETAERMTQTGPKASLVQFPAVGHAPALMESRQIGVVKEWLTRT
jgi:pimeloyl-ACP methyl ester carboxylesterase